jgi:hypothetical protein
MAIARMVGGVDRSGRAFRTFYFQPTIGGGDTNKERTAG